MALNSVLLKKETSNFQEMLSYLYTAVHIEKNSYVDCALVLEWECYEAVKMYSFLCEPHTLAFCVALLYIF